MCFFDIALDSGNEVNYRQVLSGSTQSTEHLHFSSLISHCLHD